MDNGGAEVGREPRGFRRTEFRLPPQISPLLFSDHDLSLHQLTVSQSKTGFSPSTTTLALASTFSESNALPVHP